MTPGKIWERANDTQDLLLTLVATVISNQFQEFLGSSEEQVSVAAHILYNSEFHEWNGWCILGFKVNICSAWELCTQGGRILTCAGVTCESQTVHICGEKWKYSLIQPVFKGGYIPVNVQESEEYVKRSEGDLSKLVWIGHCSLAASVRMVDRIINFDTWVRTRAKRFHLVSGFVFFFLHSPTWEMCSTLFHIFCFCAQIYVISQKPVFLPFYQAGCVIYCMHSRRICNCNNMFGGQNLSLHI